MNAWGNLPYEDLRNPTAAAVHHLHHIKRNRMIPTIWHSFPLRPHPKRAIATASAAAMNWLVCAMKTQARATALPAEKTTSTSMSAQASRNLPPQKSPQTPPQTETPLPCPHLPILLAACGKHRSGLLHFPTLCNLRKKRRAPHFPGAPFERPRSPRQTEELKRLEENLQRQLQ